jgi:lysophospholipase L1-like esterase
MHARDSPPTTEIQKMKKLLLATAIYLFASTAQAATSYILDGDSHAWRNGAGREGRPGSDFGKTGIIEGWAVDAEKASDGRVKLVANFGQGGETSAQILAGISDTADSKAEWAVVSVGHNDILRGVLAVESKRNITEIIAYHHRLGRKVMLVTPPPSTNWDGCPVAANVADQLKEELAAWMRTTDADAMLDAHELIKPEHLTDGIHIDADGGWILGEAFYRKIK